MKMIRTISLLSNLCVMLVISTRLSLDSYEVVLLKKWKRIQYDRKVISSY